MDPVVVGRDVFSVINDTVNGIVGFIQDVFCAIVDKILDITKGTCLTETLYRLWSHIYIKYYFVFVAGSLIVA